MQTDSFRTVELNGGHIEVYENSVIFFDDENEDSWEYDWKDLYKITEEVAND